MPKQAKEPAVQAPQVESKPEKVTLKLRQNAFVRGEFAREGSFHTFSREEAQKRLATSQLWERE